tara:strand:- start:288 stop:1412 length:1125 start_codon:yes stop_codon:yes gene_type:complete
MSKDNTSPPLPHVTVWGPISGATAERLGFPSEVESVLIRPTVPEVARAAEAVLKIVPEDVLPVEGDTAESLVARLELSGWLDDMEVKKSGQAKGGKHVHLNRVNYPQPRRKSWSVVVKEELEDEDGDHVHWLLAYKVPAKKSSWHCKVTAHPAPHARTSSLRLRGGGRTGRRFRGAPLEPHPRSKRALWYYIGKSPDQEEAFDDQMSERGYQGVFGGYRSERTVAGYLMEDGGERTQHALSHKQWLDYVDEQRIGVRFLVRSIFHAQGGAYVTAAEEAITLLVVPFQKRYGLKDYYEHCGGIGMSDNDPELGDWEHWKELYTDCPEDFPDRVPWKTFREFPPVYVNFNPEKRWVLHWDEPWSRGSVRRPAWQSV